VVILGKLGGDKVLNVRDDELAEVGLESGRIRATGRVEERVRVLSWPFPHLAVVMVENSRRGRRRYYNLGYIVPFSALPDFWGPSSE
jgi:hypothetical protein